MWHTIHADWIGVLVKNHDKSFQSSVMRRMTIKSQKYCRQYALLTLFAAVMYMTMPFIGSQAHRVRKYPFFGRYYYDDESDAVYVLCYFSQVGYYRYRSKIETYNTISENSNVRVFKVITGTFCATTNYALDTLFLICSYHMCAQLKILKYDLMRIRPDNVADLQITRLIRRHQKEIRYGAWILKSLYKNFICIGYFYFLRNIEKLQQVFSNLGFWQLFVACVITCINVFKMLIVGITKIIKIFCINCTGEINFFFSYFI